MINNVRIINGTIVTPSAEISQGTIEIENGMITSILPHSRSTGASHEIDASGKWILPGLIDSHSDAIEMEMQPRPTTIFPAKQAFLELEKKLVAQGITTTYHSLSMLEDPKKWVRKNENVIALLEEIRNLTNSNRLMNHFIHLRFEITNFVGAEFVKGFLKEEKIDQLSFMDHTPGQGQYRDLEVQKRYMMGKQNLTEKEIEHWLEHKKSMGKVNPAVLSDIARLAEEKGVPLASHDDDTIEKVELAQSWNAVISEFPITLEVASEAKRRGMAVAMGAPNVLLGRSHSNNLSAREAIINKAVDILCSDYYPPSLLQSIFFLHTELGIPLPQAVNMVTINPAEALGIGKQTGSLEEGKNADIIMVDLQDSYPIVEQVFVKGKQVCEMRYGLTPYNKVEEGLL
ncbi:phosphonate metabolism protein PhnM [Thalassobacillus sp. C254]|uniref:phosphonate metabolism protein PhnM n=1 Tax=Thalassobacillus sp. C254 TaxID=1225341 RepID=UPI0006CF54CF|nr:phosphonate metabolism protein PhnM [Thalassobacillus sp. C254]